MKRIISLLTIFAVAIGLTACSDEDKVIEFNKLPSAAQEFINTNFPSAKVLLITKDRGSICPEYDVTLDNQTKLEFTCKGKMKKIESNDSELVMRLLPEQIKAYLIANFENPQPIKYEIDDKKHKVKLVGDIELEFDSNYRLVEIDD